jgi:hypothetical protein
MVPVALVVLLVLVAAAQEVILHLQQRVQQTQVVAVAVHQTIILLALAVQA